MSVLHKLLYRDVSCCCVTNFVVVLAVSMATANVASAAPGLVGTATPNIEGGKPESAAVYQAVGEVVTANPKSGGCGGDCAHPRAQPSPGATSTPPPDSDFETCTGVLIRPDYILTAQHCVPLTKFKIGSSPTDFVSYPIDAWNNDPNGDMVIAHLRTPVSSLIAPMFINRGAPPAANTVCTTVGFGDHTVDGTITDDVKFSATEIVQSVASGIITVKEGTGIATHGDSGGPLLCPGFIAGLVQGHSDGDINHTQELYTLIDPAWIDSQLPFEWHNWGWISGGVAGPASSITAVINNDPVQLDYGLINLFTTGANGLLYATAGTPQTGWSDWELIGNGVGAVGGTITAVHAGSISAKQIYALFITTASGEILTNTGSWLAGWGAWTPVPGLLAGPGVAVTALPAQGGQFALFTVDANGRMFSTIGSASTQWAPWQPVGLNLAGPHTSIAAVSTGDGHFVLFGTDPSGSVITATGDPVNGWGNGWTSVAQGHAGPNASVSAIVLSAGRYGVFMTDVGGGIYATAGSAQSGWSGWSIVQQGIARIGSSVTPIKIGDGRVALFVQGPTGGVFTTSGNPTTATWTPWLWLSGELAGAGTAVTAVTSGGGVFETFMADTTGYTFANFGYNN